MTPFTFYLVIGASLIVIELLFFQLSVIWSLLIGIAALSAATTAWFIPDAGWILTTIVFLSTSLVLSALVYKPLKAWQSKPGVMPGSDLIGKEVDVITQIDRDTLGKVKWSGTDWEANLNNDSEALSVGDKAVICAVEGIRLTVKKA
ncbi:MAG: NfeD family protein [Pseudomonadota bacterium]